MEGGAADRRRRPILVSIYIYVSWEPADTRYIRADTCAGRSVLFWEGDVALVHKYLHILILERRFFSGGA